MEYRTAIGPKIFGVIFSGFFIGMGFFFLLGSPSHHLSPPVIILSILGLVMIGGGLIFGLDTVRHRVIAGEQDLTIVRVFGTRNILLSEIAGYRKGSKDSFFIELITGKKLAIPTGLERRDTLIAWIKEKYEDLDVKEKEAETDVLLENEQFGLTREDRQTRLEQARTLEIAATIGGFIIMLLTLACAKTYPLTILAAFIAPWIGVVLTWYFKGLVRLNKLKKSPYPTMIALMILPAFGAFISLFESHHFYEFQEKAWPLLIGVAVLSVSVCIAACWQAIQPLGKKTITYVFIVLTAAVYSFGVVVFSNCYLDNLPPKIYKPVVTDKRISRSKTTSYHLSLSPWGRYTEGDDVTVSSGFFDDVKEGDTIIVYLNEGRFGISWYRVGLDYKPNNQNE